MALSWLPAVLARLDVPVVPGADEARRWAQDELSRQVYQDAKPGWAEQIFAALRKALGELLSKLGVAEPNIGLVVLVVLLLLAIVAIVLVVRPRLNRRKAPSADVFDQAKVLTSAQHRALSQDAARAGDYGTAVGEMFRAMARSAEERDVSVPAVGRTASEIVSDLERAFPNQSPELLRSAELFNAVRYGDLSATPAMFAQMLDADAAIAGATPQYADEFTAAES